jgi:hypothetical protein
MTRNYCACSVSANENSSELSPTLLETLFSKAGDVIFFKLSEDRQTGQPGGMTFVEESTPWKARSAVSMLNRTDFTGKNVLVKEAIFRRDSRGR